MMGMIAASPESGLKLHLGEPLAERLRARVQALHELRLRAQHAHRGQSAAGDRRRNPVREELGPRALREQVADLVARDRRHHPSRWARPSAAPPGGFRRPRATRSATCSRSARGPSSSRTGFRLRSPAALWPRCACCARSRSSAERLHTSSQTFRERLTEVGFSPLSGDAAIIPIIVGDTAFAIELSGRLLDEGVFVTGFGYPVVPEGTARVRVQMSAALEPEHLDRAIAAFEKVGHEAGLLTV